MLGEGLLVKFVTDPSREGWTSGCRLLAARADVQRRWVKREMGGLRDLCET